MGLLRPTPVPSLPEKKILGLSSRVAVLVVGLDRTEVATTSQHSPHSVLQALALLALYALVSSVHCHNT
jgi:hypothetical protein